MSAKAISEQTGKELLYKYICTTSAIQNRFKYARVTPDTDWARLLQDHPWLLSQSLVVKPDQLIKRRGKLGLVGVNLTLDGVKSWLKPRLGHEATVGKAKGFLKNFLIEPFVPHSQAEEFYVCIYATREGDYVLFHHEGGVDVGDVDAKAQKLLVGVDEKLNTEDIKRHLLVHAPEDKKEILASFISGLFNFYEDLYFTYLEINPLVVTKDGVYILDLAAKVDATADYICKVKWGDIEFPPPFGREAYPEEAYIADLDAKSGASLKLTLLNPKGRIWTMVAGGGASVVYSDTICDLGGVNELANYGEYSGAPSEQQTYDYAKTILSLMTREKHPDGKILIIGGSIANFTNVAATFKGIVRAIRDYQGPLKEHEVTIFVRRGGPNYQEGLRVMGEVGKTTGIPIHVFGTETHMTAIVGMALGHRPIPNQPPTAAHTANFLLNASGSTSTPAPSRTASFSESRADEVAPAKKAKPAMPQDSVPSPRSLQGKSATLFSRHTKAIVWGMQTRAVQGMLDFDYVCSRDEPSVAAMVYPFTGDHKQKFYWGHKEILIPVFKNMADAMKKHPEVDVLINFASLRSAYDSTMETMSYAQVDDGRQDVWVGNQKELLNGIHSYGQLGQRTWERLGFETQTGTKIAWIPMLPRITCVTVASYLVLQGNTTAVFALQVQFGHAGACANQASETAVAKNQALKEAGVFVPRSFDELGEIIQSVYEDLVAKGAIVPAQEVPPPTVPMDYSWARELGLIRKPASFMTSICDERGQELIYAGMPITEVFKEEMGIGGVLGLLWFQRRLPKYSCPASFGPQKQQCYFLTHLFCSFFRETNEKKCTGSILGHYLDQKRLKQGLYRHPWDDISYVLPEHMSM
ncbi:ATP-citrate synthase isoform X2 [Cricetulus griseus]|uniref:ATP-citrate synthase isoform X2 n=1 Tax=Cricetulus griseus TaxID=10029 RepID=UPI000F745A98|nr:ATP-citrate synthase isoform X2 [Cricetulus griseus]